jgi:hypothetical protein
MLERGPLLSGTFSSQKSFAWIGWGVSGAVDHSDVLVPGLGAGLATALRPRIREFLHLLLGHAHYRALGTVGDAPEVAWRTVALEGQGRSQQDNQSRGQQRLLLNEDLVDQPVSFFA